MVLYFSGTGNSLYIAKQIAAALHDRIVSIADCVRNNEYSLPVTAEEKIGYVFPVIACAPPDIVTDFIKNVHFIGYQNNYSYSVFNCAGTPEYTSRIMKETSRKAGIPIRGFFGVLMPGNYITKKKHLPEEKVRRYLADCDKHINEIILALTKNVSNYKKEKHSYLLSYVVHKLAVLEKTEPFIFGDACIGCGKCAAIYSMGAITLHGKKPIREEKACAFCLGCVNVCPTHALQIGKKTQGNPQYINPYYDGKARRQDLGSLKL